MTASDVTSNVIELDSRTGDGLDVQLFWHPTTDTVSVSVFDTTHEQAFELRVDAADALDAFNHPFAYAAFQGVPFTTPCREHDDQPVPA